MPARGRDGEEVVMEVAQVSLLLLLLLLLPHTTEAPAAHAPLSYTALRALDGELVVNVFGRYSKFSIPSACSVCCINLFPFFSVDEASTLSTSFLPVAACAGGNGGGICSVFVFRFDDDHGGFKFVGVVDSSDGNDGGGDSDGDAKDGNDGGGDDDDVVVVFILWPLRFRRAS